MALGERHRVAPPLRLPLRLPLAPRKGERRRARRVPRQPDAVAARGDARARAPCARGRLLARLLRARPRPAAVARVACGRAHQGGGQLGAARVPPPRDGLLARAGLRRERHPAQGRLRLVPAWHAQGAPRADVAVGPRRHHLPRRLVHHLRLQWRAARHGRLLEPAQREWRLGLRARSLSRGRRRRHHALRRRPRPAEAHGHARHRRQSARAQPRRRVSLPDALGVDDHSRRHLAPRDSVLRSRGLVGRAARAVRARGEGHRREDVRADGAHFTRDGRWALEGDCHGRAWHGTGWHVHPDLHDD
mmetsp:Transcript_15055/g.34543  ORF Transcript_15055/g.34543 Transcript_15055/m.34543 type:complete len:304 (+) Transcript_15055:2143-3054(+)